MEQDNVLDKIDDLIETNNYKKLYTYLIVSVKKFLPS